MGCYAGYTQQRTKQQSPDCERKWERGSQGGLTAGLKANPCKTPLPSILLANVQSMENKLDYLKLNLTTKWEMRDCCTIVPMKTDGEAKNIPVGQELGSRR